MSERIRVTVVDDSDEDTLQFTWQYADYAPWQQYRVARGLFLQRVLQVRDAMQQLVDAARNGDRASFKHRLAEVARSGYRLYNWMFSGFSSTDKQLAAVPKKWLANKAKSGTHTITFDIPTKLRVPWGLVYDQPVPGNDEIDRDNFWCLKFSTVTNYFVVPVEGADDPWPAEHFESLFWAYKPLWDKVLNGVLAEESARLAALLHPDGPKFELKEVSEIWERRRDDDPHGLIGFYSHANPGEILANPNPLRAVDFAEMFERSDLPNKPPTLVFLAGCRTAANDDLLPDFVRATTLSGFAGFIGTEVMVPDLFTLRFVIRFLDEFHRSGQTVADTMLVLRRKHWPLSLVFSLCCVRHLRVVPNAASAAPPLPEVNLSDQKVTA